METWHRLGNKDELLARVPFAVKLERHPIAVFLHDGAFRAIANTCNHKGGPLCEGRLRGEFVMCPWHGWEYSVVTGHGPGGLRRGAGAGLRGRGARGRRLRQRRRRRRRASCVKHKPSHLLEEHPKPPGAPPRVLGHLDDGDGCGQSALLDLRRAARARDRARRGDARAPTRSSSGCAISRFRRARGTTRRRRTPAPGRAPSPSAIPTDQLTAVYEGLVHWADVVLLATPIRWGDASSLYFKMAERLNCIQNQITIAQQGADQATRWRRSSSPAGRTTCRRSRAGC